MEEWKTYELKDICELIPGYAFKSGDFGDYVDRVIKIGDIQPPYVSYETMAGVNIQGYDRKRLDKFLVKKGDFVLAMTGATIGKIGRYIYDTPAYLNQRVLLFKPIPTVNKGFVYYTLLSPLFQKYILNHIDSETAQPNISGRSVSGFEVCLPPRKEQDRIAEILTALDDKIELNNRINHNLEEQAQALYKSWFVGFEPFKNGLFVDSELGSIPDGWTIKRVGELPLFIADYVANGSFASLKDNVKLYESENFAVFIRNTDLKAGVFPIYVDSHSYNFLTKTKLTGGEIIISNVGDVGSVHFCPKLHKPMTLGNNVIMIKADKRQYHAFLYLCFKYFSGHHSIDGITGGSAMPKFNKTDFKGIKLVVPPSSVLSRFDEIASPLFECIERNRIECDKLSIQRDSLLPVLMSGKQTC